MDNFINQGGSSGLPFSTPPELQGSKPPKSAPGDGLKGFIESGALEAFRKPEEHNATQMGQKLTDYLNMFKQGF